MTTTTLTTIELGVVAAGYSSKIQFEQRQLYRDSSRNTGRHFVIVWKTSQLLEPTVVDLDVKIQIRKFKMSFLFIFSKIILEAPDDILAVKFNPLQPYIIVASCHTGMIVVWDISYYASLVRDTSTSWASRPTETPVLVPIAATLENYPCTSKRLDWAPSSVEV